MPPAPIEGVSTAVFRNGRVLLVLRKNPPYANHWSLPGGRARPGETLEEAARRELYEETSLQVTGKLVRADRFSFPGDTDPGASFTVTVFATSEAIGEPKAQDDALEAAWFPLHEIATLKTTPGLATALAKAQRVAAGHEQERA
jgi:ADP-ribose pyrophosphatase YjhB (NUDIX family)